jgi:hypothetical protein
MGLDRPRQKRSASDWRPLTLELKKPRRVAIRKRRGQRPGVTIPERVAQRTLQVCK